MRKGGSDEPPEPPLVTGLLHYRIAFSDFPQRCTTSIFEGTTRAQICMKLGVRSLANASRARQFNPLNLPGVGTASSNKYGSRGRSCVVVSGRLCAVVHGRARSCTVVRAWSVMHGHAWSCVVVRGRAWSCVVVRGRARSCAVVRGLACVVGHSWSCVHGRARVVGHSWSCVVGRARSCRSACFAASTAVTRTNNI